MRTTLNPYQNNHFGAYLTSKNTVSNGRTNYIYSFQGQESDDEIKGEGNSINYTYRMHDPRLGRFLSIDPFTSTFPHITPYHFVSNSPIAKIDIGGGWDIEVHIDPSRKKGNEGILILRNNAGEIVATFKAGGRGTHHNRSKTNGDTPLGRYQILEWKASASKKDFKSYGDVRLRLLGKEGEIVEGSKGRSGIAVHGARHKNAAGENAVNHDGSLWNTQGCVRLSLDDANELYRLTQELEKSDPMEAPGVLDVHEAKEGKTYVDYIVSEKTLADYWSIKQNDKVEVLDEVKVTAKRNPIEKEKKYERTMWQKIKSVLYRDE